MKIAILLTDINSRGGVARVVANLANSFSKLERYEVTVVSCFKPENKNIEYNIVDSVKIKYLNIDINIKINKIKKQIYFIKEIKKALKEEAFDLVITTNAHLNIYTSLAAKKLKSKVIGCEHGAYDHLSKGWRVITQLTYKNLDSLVLLTSKEIDRYKINKNKIAVIPNMSFIENNLVSNLENKSIAMVSRIDENKNIVNAIEVFSKIEKKHRDWVLNIYGSGEEKDVQIVKNKIKKLKLKNVNLLGFQNNSESIYLTTDILLMTSKSEGLPMVLIEAISYGVPAVTYDIKTGPSDIIINNKTGFLIEPFNKDKMVEKIEYLIDNNEVLKKMAVNAKKDSKKFSEKNIINKWVCLFKSLVGGE